MDESKLRSLLNRSTVVALKVGDQVEELDLADFMALMELMELTDNPDIRVVYQNFMKGSRNQLRSFNPQIRNCGGDFGPRYLMVCKFQEIIITFPREGPD